MGQHIVLKRGAELYEAADVILGRKWAVRDEAGWYEAGQGDMGRIVQ